MTENAPIKADDGRFSHLNQGKQASKHKKMRRTIWRLKTIIWTGASVVLWQVTR
jgi:hypothetical protein